MTTDGATHEADAGRRLDAWERYRALWDAIEFKRKTVDTADNKAKLALTIMGALNAAVCYVLLRGDATTLLPRGVRPWFAGMLVVYGVVTFVFMVQAIEALRPRPESRARVLAQARREAMAGRPAGAPGSLGLFVPHGTRLPGLHEELQRWRGVSADHVNAELVGINRTITGVLERQIAALERVYRGLRLLLVLAAAMLALVGAVWCMRPAA
jgi:hypothetical protein